jgi:hypothetical protein
VSEFLLTAALTEPKQAALSTMQLTPSSSASLQTGRLSARRLFQALFIVLKHLAT